MTTTPIAILTLLSVANQASPFLIMPIKYPKEKHANKTQISTAQQRSTVKPYWSIRSQSP